MKKLLIIPAFFLCCAVCSQEMKVHKTNGTVESFLLADIEKITFSVNGDDGETFTDPRDGRVYKIKTIGSQTWMTENLAYLPNVYPSTEDSYSLPYYYVYGYEGRSVSDAKARDNYRDYGALYNSPAANEACPTGWHCGDDDEWKQLIAYLGGAETAGLKMKSITGWPSGDEGDNSSGFTALPSAGRLEDGNFRWLGTMTYFWVLWKSSENSTNWARYWTLGNTAEAVWREATRHAGFAVRCIKD